MTSILACSWLLLPSFVSLHSPDSWKLSGFLLLNDWVADHRNRLNGRDAAAALFLHDLHSWLLLFAPAAFSSKLVSLPESLFELLWAAAATLSPSLFPFMILPPEESTVSEHLRIRNQKWLLYEYLKTTFCFFGNAIWGLCRCNFEK